MNFRFGSEADEALVSDLARIDLRRQSIGIDSGSRLNVHPQRPLPRESQRQRCHQTQRQSGQRECEHAEGHIRRGTDGSHPKTPESSPEQRVPRRDVPCLKHIDGNLARIHVHYRNRHARARPSVTAIHQGDAIACADGDPQIEEAFLPFLPLIALDEEGQVLRGRYGGGRRRRPRLPAVGMDIRRLCCRRDVCPAMALNVDCLAGSRKADTGRLLK